MARYTGILLIAAVLAVFIASAYVILTGPAVGNLFAIAGGGGSCQEAISNLNCASQVNGVVTSLSQVTIGSNYGPLNGQVFIYGLTLNGAGQYVSGTITAQQVAQQINASSTVASDYNINIQAQLNRQKLVIPYTYSGEDIVALSPETISFPFSWFSSGAGVLTTCVQQNQTQSSLSYTVACSGQASGTDFTNIFQAYTADCAAAGGRTFLAASGASTVAKTKADFTVTGVKMSVCVLGLK